MKITYTVEIHYPGMSIDHLFEMHTLIEEIAGLQCSYGECTPYNDQTEGRIIGWYCDTLKEAKIINTRLNCFEPRLAQTEWTDNNEIIDEVELSGYLQ